MPLWQPSKALARPDYYDRDAIPQFITYQNTVAPHGLTVRASYSPAFPFAAFIENMVARMTRVTAAAPAASMNLYADFVPFFGGTARIFWLFTVDNTLFAGYTFNGNSFGYMAYGDTLTLSTGDASTGGTVSFLASEKGTEFLY
jgi:hypothetical protein